MLTVPVVIASLCVSLIILQVVTLTHMMNFNCYLPLPLPLSLSLSGVHSVLCGGALTFAAHLPIFVHTYACVGQVAGRHVGLECLAREC